MKSSTIILVSSYKPLISYIDLGPYLISDNHISILPCFPNSTLHTQPTNQEHNSWLEETAMTTCDWVKGLNGEIQKG